MGRVRFLATDQRTKKKGHKLPAHIAAAIAEREKAERELWALREQLVALPVKVELPVGEYAWHEAKQKGTR